MTTVTIYHNPRCSKSRQTLQLLKDQGIEPEIQLYLDNPPSTKTITQLIDLLDIEPIEVVRTKEKEFKEAGLTKDASKSAIIEALHAYPRLIERPIVVKGDKAAMGRPPENVLGIL